MTRKMKAKPLVPRTRAVKEAMALQPLIDDVQDSLDRFQVLYEEGGNLDDAILDLHINFEQLEDGVDKNGQAK